MPVQILLGWPVVMVSTGCLFLRISCQLRGSRGGGGLFLLSLSSFSPAFVLKPSHNAFASWYAKNEALKKNAEAWYAENALFHMNCIES